MLRPIYWDLLDVVTPLVAVTVALFVGRNLYWLLSIFFRGVVGATVLLIVLLGVSYFVTLPPAVDEIIWRIGGATTLASVLAAVLLGVVWSLRQRSTSTAFLRVLVGLIALIIVLNTGGRLWWRWVDHAAWQNVANAQGGVVQSSGWTCLPATAAMLLHHHGIAGSEGELAYLANTSYLGTDVRSIAQALSTKGQSHGLRAQFARASYEDCLRRMDPFIACVNIPGIGGHAVLVLKVNTDKVELIDPRFGRRQTVPRAEFATQWDGRMVAIVKTVSRW